MSTRTCTTRTDRHAFEIGGLDLAGTREPTVGAAKSSRWTAAFSAGGVCPMTDQIWSALIAAAALLLAGYLGYVLRGRAERSAEARETLREQLNRVYDPIYNLLKDSVPPDEPLSEIDAKAVERIVEIAKANRKLLERQLVSIVDSIDETRWQHGSDAIDERELGALWQHVQHKRNQLQKALGFPHEPHWANLPLSELLRKIRSWWWDYTWKRDRKRRERPRKRKTASNR